MIKSFLLYTISPSLQRNDLRALTFLTILICLCRFVYWSETSPTGLTSHKQLDLRQTSLNQSTTLNRSIRQHKRTLEDLRDEATLASIPSLTPALALDPVTGELLLCNAESGDVLRCDPAQGNCSVEVNHTALQALHPERESVGELHKHF